MAPPNPGVPYVKLYIGGEEISLANKRRLVSFNMTKETNSTSRAHFELIDEEWTHIEQLIEKHHVDGVTFRYGWLGSKSSQHWSEEHRMNVQYYLPEIFDRYATISFDGSIINPETVEGGVNPRTKYGTHLTYVLKEKSAADAIRKIFREMKFDISRVDNTKDFAKIHNSVDSTLAQYPVFLINDQSAIQVFINELRYWAIDPETGDSVSEESNGTVKGSNNTGQGGYYMYFVESDPPQVVLTKHGKQGQLKATFNLPVNHEGKREVISCSFNKPILAGTTGGDGTERVFSMDKMTGIAYSLRTQNYQEFPLTSGTQVIDPIIDDGINSAQIINYADGGRTASVGALVQYIESSHNVKLSNWYGTATLAIPGRVDLNVDDIIQLNVWINRWRNNKPARELHSYSGTWQIGSCTNTIMDGWFATQLDLRKLSGIKKVSYTGGSVNLYQKNFFNVANDINGGKLQVSSNQSRSFFSDSGYIG